MLNHGAAHGVCVAEPDRELRSGLVTHRIIGEPFDLPTTLARYGCRREAAQRLQILLSRFDVKPVSDAVMDAAAQLLDISGLDGHEGLVDALVVATAALCAPPVLLATSDTSHIPALCKAAEDLPGSPKVKIVNV
ncbi:hypothetical protein [Streptomyces sp. CA-251247]|uniref:hypothetical protein n=1 Tax=Streptomyces sp. CA-251247 TaxID=3240062 RepID=UPI003D92536A